MNGTNCIALYRQGASLFTLNLLRCLLNWLSGGDSHILYIDIYSGVIPATSAIYPTGECDASSFFISILTLF